MLRVSSAVCRASRTLAQRTVATTQPSGFKLTGSKPDSMFKQNMKAFNEWAFSHPGQLFMTSLATGTAIYVVGVAETPQIAWYSAGYAGMSALTIMAFGWMGIYLVAAATGAIFVFLMYQAGNGDAKLALENSKAHIITAKDHILDEFNHAAHLTARVERSTVKTSSSSTAPTETTIVKVERPALLPHSTSIPKSTTVSTAPVVEVPIVRSNTVREPTLVEAGKDNSAFFSDRDRELDLHLRTAEAEALAAGRRAEAWLYHAEDRLLHSVRGFENWEKNVADDWHRGIREMREATSASLHSLEQQLYAREGGKVHLAVPDKRDTFTRAHVSAQPIPKIEEEKRVRYFAYQPRNIPARDYIEPDMTPEGEFLSVEKRLERMGYW